MRKLFAKELKIKFIEALSDSVNFSYEDGNPFLIKLGTKRFFIFLKNLSPAYFKNSPDVTRVQLPYSDHFSKIFKADIPFIILGYDADNDTLVCWNPKQVKQRLNAKSNVSLYSRESLQTKVKPTEFKSGYLSNGEKIIIFKRINLKDFFDNIPVLFKETKGTKEDEKTSFVSEPLTEYSTDRLHAITEKSLILEIKPLLKKNKVLEAVEVCAKFYNGKYKSMTFKDWFKLVNKHYQDNSAQG
jgi:hypothetical protein